MSEERLGSIEDRLTSSGRRLDNIDSRLASVEVKVDRIEVKVDWLAGKVDGLEVKVDGLEVKVDDLGHRMLVLHESTIETIKVLAPDFAPIRREFTAADSKLREDVDRRLIPLEAIARRRQRRPGR